MSEPHETPLQEAISFITIGAILVGVACYIAAQQNLPFASPAPFWAASMVYHWFPGFDAIRAPQMHMLVGAATRYCCYYLLTHRVFTRSGAFAQHAGALLTAVGCRSSLCYAISRGDSAGPKYESTQREMGRAVSDSQTILL
jgi:hypothetical protein